MGWGDEAFHVRERCRKDKKERYNRYHRVPFVGLVWGRGGADVPEPWWLSKERRWQRSGNHVRNGLGSVSG